MESKKPTKEEKLKELEETKQYFADKKKSLEEMRITAKVQFERFDWDSQKDKDSYMVAKWSWLLCKQMYEELGLIWEDLEAITTGLMEEGLAKDEVDLTGKVTKIEKDLKKHRPALLEFERIMKASRAEQRANR